MALQYTGLTMARFGVLISAHSEFRPERVALDQAVRWRLGSRQVSRTDGHERLRPRLIVVREHYAGNLTVSFVSAFRYSRFEGMAVQSLFRTFSQYPPSLNRFRISSTEMRLIGKAR